MSLKRDRRCFFDLHSVAYRWEHPDTNSILYKFATDEKKIIEQYSVLHRDQESGKLKKGYAIYKIDICKLDTRRVLYVDCKNKFWHGLYDSCTYPKLKTNFPLNKTDQYALFMMNNRKRFDAVVLANIMENDYGNDVVSDSIIVATEYFNENIIERYDNYKEFEKKN